MVQSVAVLILGSLLSINIQAPQDTKERQRFVVKGRVVDERGQPVSSAIVVLIPKVSVETSGSMTVYHKTTPEGRFSIKESDIRGIRKHVLYVTDDLPADAELPLSPPFAGLVSSSQAFSGLDITPSESSEIDLGDVPLQVRYGRVFIHLQDHTGAKLRFDAYNTTLVPNIKLRVRNALGDVVSECWVSEKGFHAAESTITVALPEGHWQLELAGPAKGDTVIWHPPAYPVFVRATVGPLNVFVRVGADDDKSVSHPILPAYEPKVARRMLRDMGIAFSREAFLERVERQNTNAVVLFLVSGIDPDSRGRYGNTALMLAAGLGIPDIVRALLSKGAGVNTRNHFGVTPLMLAAASFDSDIVKLLLSSGAQVNDQANDGRTALMMAVANDRMANVKLLLASDADVNLRDKSGKTAIQLGSELGRTQVIELLKGIRER